MRSRTWKDMTRSVASGSGSSPARGHKAEQAFRGLYDANFTAVLGYALRRVDQSADAADVVAEAPRRSPAG